MEDGDLPHAVCHEEEIVGLIKWSHFHIWVCFKIHCAGETGDVLAAGLVHFGEQVEKGIPGGVEGHGVFYFYEIDTAVEGFGFNNDERMRQKYDKRFPTGDPGNSSRAPPQRWYPLGARWYPLEKGYPMETRRYPLEKRNLAWMGDSR